MTYRIHWDYDHHALHVSLSGELSLEGLRRLNDELLYYLNALNPFRANLILIGTGIYDPRLNPNDLREQMSFLRHEALGWVIDVDCRQPRVQATLHALCRGSRCPTSARTRSNRRSTSLRCTAAAAIRKPSITITAAKAAHASHQPCP